MGVGVSFTISTLNLDLQSEVLELPKNHKFNIGDVKQRQRNIDEEGIRQDVD